MTLFLYTSCNKDRAFQKTCDTENPLEDIEWLKLMKASFEDNQHSDKIVQYTYNKRGVYFIESCPTCPDMMFYVYDCEQNVICQFGGIAGMNTCPDFFDDAKNKKVLYED